MAVRYKWLPGAARYYDMEQHRLVAAAKVRTWMWGAIEASYDPINTLAEAVSNGRIAPADWQAMFRREIKDQILTQYLLGRGGLAAMTQAEYGSVGGMVAEQYKWLDGFVADISSGKLSEAQIAARSRMYARSAQEAYWRATMRATGLPPLPALPGSGDSKCLTNCRCGWQILQIRRNKKTVGWKATWLLGATEDHCTAPGDYIAPGIPHGCEERAALWNPLYLWLPGHSPEELAMKSYPKPHKGRPGQRGGSLPRGDNETSTPALPYAFDGPFANSAASLRRQELEQVIRSGRFPGVTLDEAEHSIVQTLHNIAAAPLAIRRGLHGANGVLKDGRFKTQFETGSSGGYFDLTMRTIAEENGLNVPDDIDPKLRPVYGFFDVGVASDSGSMVSRYGAVEFVLKDEVKKRTTIYADDSLADFENNKGAGTPALHPTIASSDNQIIELVMGIKNPKYHLYHEAQIHGGVTVRDVQRIVFHLEALSWTEAVEGTTGILHKSQLRPEYQAIADKATRLGIEVTYDQSTF